MKRNLLITLLIILLFGLISFSLIKFYRYRPKELKLPQVSGYWGITYSKKFATSIGLDWQETFLALVDDLGVKTIRLPVYWDNVETNEGSYNFTDYDWLLDQGAKHNVHFILAVGRRLPRWPECHSPEWTHNYKEAEIQNRIERFIKATVMRYRGHPEVSAWQLENEYFLNSFGECPPGQIKNLKAEYKLVKTLDSRPIVITASGERSDWMKEATIGDVLGTTLYRSVWSPYLGYLQYPWPPRLYTSKARQAGLEPNKVIVAELQAEPWAPNSTLDKLPVKEANKSFSLDDFKANLQYASDTKFGQVWLWGAEWWYLQKKTGNSSYWDLAKTLAW